MKNIKPICVTFDKETLIYKDVVISAIVNLLSTAGISLVIQTANFDNWWNDEEWIKNPCTGSETLDSFIKRRIKAIRAAIENDGKLDVPKILTCCSCEPQQWNNPHYDLFVLSKRISNSEAGGCEVIGLSKPLFGGVISLDSFQKVEGREKERCIQALAYHEMGHVFDIPSHFRENSIWHDDPAEYGHCANICLMNVPVIKKVLRLEDEGKEITDDQIKAGKFFCSDCKKDLKNFFAE